MIPGWAPQLVLTSLRPRRNRGFLPAGPHAAQAAASKAAPPNRTPAQPDRGITSLRRRRPGASCQQLLHRGAAISQPRGKHSSSSRSVANKWPPTMVNRCRSCFMRAMNNGPRPIARLPRPRLPSRTCGRSIMLLRHCRLPPRARKPVPYPPRRCPGVGDSLALAFTARPSTIPTRRFGSR